MSESNAFFNRTFTLGQSLGWLGLVLAVLTLGAHFYRASEYGIVLICAGMLLFLTLRSSWKQYAVALFLLWGAVEWGESAYTLALIRRSMGMPWLRGSVILMGVGLVTALAGWYGLLRARQKDEPGSPALLQGAVFVAVFVILFYLRQGSPLRFLLLERYIPNIGSVQIFLAAWYAAFVAGLLANPKKSRKTRKRVWLIFGVAFFGQFLLGTLGLDRMLLTGNLHVPIPAFILYGPLFRDSLGMMPFIVLGSVLLAGSAWCSMLCYLGPFDALAAGNKGLRPYPRPVQTALKYGRAAVLVTGCLAALGLRMAGMELGAAVGIAVAYAFASLLIMAALSRRYHGLTHCMTACPMGLVVNLLGGLSPWRVRVSPEHCDNCGACEKVCQYSAITRQSRAAGKTLMRCSLCRDCIGACKAGAIALRCPGLSPQTSWTLFTGLVAALHAVFLSTAMV